MLEVVPCDHSFGSSIWLQVTRLHCSTSRGKSSVFMWLI